MPATITPEEEAQLMQTVEMFEVITQSQPQDYQSLEILKEAYVKLDRQKDVVGTSKRIAAAYVQLGQLSSAIMEYETILQKNPDDKDVLKALAEIENKTGPTVELPRPEVPDPKKPKLPADGVDDGKVMMQKIFVDAKLIPAGDFNMYWSTPEENPAQVVEPFLQVLADKAVMPADKSVKLVCERARVGYMPFEKYDIDGELARSFPKASCMRWCVLPFDRMSKTVFVATTNPFNNAAKSELQAATGYRLQFYMVTPADLVKNIKKVFRL